MIAGIAEILGAGREYHLFNSFEGLPPAQSIDGESSLKWQLDNADFNCLADIAEAEKAIKLTGCNYYLHKGWFNQTLPNFKPARPIALLRLDGDWYESTLTSLQYLYPCVAKNGLIILDDYYHWDGCTKAVHDYLSSIKSGSKISHSEGVCFI